MHGRSSEPSELDRSTFSDFSQINERRQDHNLAQGFRASAAGVAVRCPRCEGDAPCHELLATHAGPRGSERRTPISQNDEHWFFRFHRFRRRAGRSLLCKSEKSAKSVFAVLHEGSANDEAGAAAAEPCGRRPSPVIWCSGQLALTPAAGRKPFCRATKTESSTLSGMRDGHSP